MSELQLQSQSRIFGGRHAVYSHASKSTQCDMTFAVYLPPQVETGPRPVLYFLSGLTCTWENFMTKAGAQRYAAEHGVILVAPDTSPRGEGVADEDAWDIGTGAGFYVNATQMPWAKHYRMYDYVVDELPRVIEANFPVAKDRVGVFGHSMGGHGALMIAARNPGRYRTVSALSPICAPLACAWGEKAFTTYLGSDREAWRQYDTCALLDDTDHALAMLVDQGGEDEFLQDYLKPELLQQVCERKGHKLTYHLREGYDHGYYFVASFIGDHIAHHASVLNEGL